MILSLIATVIKVLVIAGFVVAFVPGFVAWLERVNLRGEETRQRMLKGEENVDFEEELALPRFAAFVGLLWEGVINAMTFAIYLWGYSDPDPQSEFEVDQGTTPILLIHGYTMNRSCWTYFRWRFKQAGRSNVFTINFPPFGTIEQFSNQLSRRIDRILELTGAEKIILIGHSQGTVVSSHYIQNGGADKVATLVALGGVLHGTKMGPVGIGANAKQLSLGSPLLNELSQGYTKMAEDVQIICIGSRHDNLVIPFTSAFIYDSDLVDNVTLEYLGHNTLMYSAQVFDQMMRRIDRPQATDAA